MQLLVLTADILYKQLLPKSNEPNSEDEKLPNGFGQISEIKTGNLYKPFRAMVTVGKDFTADQFVNCSNPLHSSRLTMRLMLH